MKSVLWILAVFLTISSVQPFSVRDYLSRLRSSKREVPTNMRNKLEAIFVAHDTIKDGVWRADDIKEYEKRMISLNHLNIAKAASLRKRANAWWDACLNLSSTNPRTLTKEQYVVKMAELHDKDAKAFKKLFDNIVDTMVGLVDVDDDGYITKAEFDNSIRALGFDPIPHFDKILAREGNANGIAVSKLDEILEQFLGKNGKDNDLVLGGIKDSSSG